MKKVMSLLTAMCMIVSMIPAVSATHWADADIAYLVENGAIAEDDVMLDNLDTPITRSQMVKVIVALLKGEEPIKGKEYFTDISLEDTHIAKAAANGFVNGFGDGTFRPNNPITRQDFFTIVGRAYKLEGEATNEFTDANSIADYAKPYVNALQSIGIVNGYGDGTVNPRGNITIAETLAVMHRTDEHVKANTPKEEEKPKAPGGGSGTSGSSGGGPGAFGGGSSGIKPTTTISAVFSIEYADDYSSGIVAYVTPTITEYEEESISMMALIRGNKNIWYDQGDRTEAWQVALQRGYYVPEKNGKFAIPDYGTYTLHIFNSHDEVWAKFEVSVAPKKSDDTTPPELTVIAPEETTLPYKLEVNASDNVGVARLSYVKYSGIDTNFEEKGKAHKLQINERTDITDGGFTVTEEGTYIVGAMDTGGNCTYATVTVYNEKPIIVNYASESINDYGTKSPDTVYFDVEYTNDLASGAVAYITADVNIPNVSDRIILIRGDNPTFGDYGGYAGGPGRNTYENANIYNAHIPIKDGKYAVSEYGPYTLVVESTRGVIAGKYKIMVTPPKSEDVTPPTLTLELPEDLAIPLEVKVNASDDVELARIDYTEVRYTKTSYKEKGYMYKVNTNGRTDITDGRFTLKEGGSYAICAMDTSGNCAFAVIAVDLYGDEPVSIAYVSESISEYLEESPDESGYDTAPPKGGEGTPTATLTAKLEDDFSGDYVATITPEYSLNPETTIVKSYLVAGSNWQWPAGGMKNVEAQLQTFILSGAVIEEQEGVFRVPDFGNYQCFVLDSDGNYGASEVITVTPPESEDVTPPTLRHFYFDKDKGFPRTVAVKTSDDVEVARVSYVNIDKCRGFDGKIEDYFKATVRGRKIVEGNSITITEKGYYAICAMDTSGNCTYSAFQVKENGKTSTPSLDLTAPIINYSLSTEDECDGTVTITTDIYDDHSVVACGWFFMREYNEMPGGVEQVKRGAKSYLQSYITFDDLDEEVKSNDFRCGGVGSICVLSNYYKARGAGINGFMGDTTITAKENGVYFINAWDKSNNLKVVRIDINNIKAPTAEYTLEYGDFGNGSCARVAVSVDANKDAPIKKMYLVKDSAIPSVEIGGDKYYACTENFKIQKEIAAIEEGGDYITEQEGYFQIPSFGAYTLYIIDEFGNCSTTPINVAQPQ